MSNPNPNNQGQSNPAAGGQAPVTPAQNDPSAEIGGPNPGTSDQQKAPQPEDATSGTKKGADIKGVNDPLSQQPGVRAPDNVESKPESSGTGQNR